MGGIERPRIIPLTVLHTTLYQKGWALKRKINKGTIRDRSSIVATIQTEDTQKITQRWKKTIQRFKRLRNGDKKIFNRSPPTGANKEHDKIQ